MNSLRRLARLSLVSLLLAAPAAVAEPVMHAPAPGRDLSFADLYRLTASSEWPLTASVAPTDANASAGAGAPPRREFEIRTVASEMRAAAQPSPYVFSVGHAAPPGGALLVLVGLAAGLWVARRRLGYAIRG